MLKFSKTFLVPILVLLALGGGGTAIYFYRQYQAAREQGVTTTAEETRKLTERVGELIELPADEEPTIATVSDKEKLQDQLFFASAENGDKVLIYVRAQKAILYRPSTHKIIEVAPIQNLGGSQNAPPDAP